MLGEHEMHQLIPDFVYSEPWIVTTYHRDVSTVCRVCLKRNAPESPVVVVAGPNYDHTGGLRTLEKSTLPPLVIVTALCVPCYERVRAVLKEQEWTDLDLPSLTSLRLHDRYDDGEVFYRFKHRLFSDAKSIIERIVGQLKSSPRSRG